MGLGFLGGIIVGGFAGWIASMIMKAKTGVFGNIALGILGAIILNALLSYIGIYAETAWMPQLVVGAAGACLLIWAYRKATTP